MTNASTAAIELNSFDLEIGGTRRGPTNLAVTKDDYSHYTNDRQASVPNGTSSEFTLSFRPAERIYGATTIDSLSASASGVLHLQVDGTLSYPVEVDNIRHRIWKVVGKKLRPLSQWLCDECGLPILRPRDGWLEYDNVSDDKPHTYAKFRIVHHRMASPRKEGCYGPDDQYTDHLSEVIEQGLNWALEMLGDSSADPTGFGDRVDLVAWTDLCRRLWLPYYEQSRQYFSQAIADDITDRDSLSGLGPDLLERIVDRYVSNELAPEPIFE